MLVPVAPLTSIAAAVALDPDIVESAEQVVVMGGSASGGSMTSQAEFNIYLDPVAARVAGNRPNAAVSTGADSAKFYDLLKAVVSA